MKRLVLSLLLSVGNAIAEPPSAACGEPPAASTPSTLCAAGAERPAPGDKSQTPILIRARTIHVTSSLDKIDALLAAFDTGPALLIQCDRIEIAGSHPAAAAKEALCAGDVQIRSGTCEVQAERVRMEGNRLVLEGSAEHPVLLLKRSKDRGDIHLKAERITLVMPSTGCPLSNAKTVEQKKSTTKHTQHTKSAKCD